MARTSNSLVNLVAEAYKLCPLPCHAPYSNQRSPLDPCPKHTHTHTSYISNHLPSLFSLVLFINPPAIPLQPAQCRRPGPLFRHSRPLRRARTRLCIAVRRREIRPGLRLFLPFLRVDHKRLAEELRASCDSKTEKETGARTGREDGNSPYNDPLGRTAGYSAALSSPPNKTTVRAFLMARSTPPRNAPSMRANATSRPEGSTTAMLSLICWAEAAARAALRTEVANASEMLWWISGAGLVALLGWQEGVVVACKGQVRSERRRRRRIRRGRVEEG